VRDEELRRRAKRLRDREFTPYQPDFWNRKYTDDVEQLEWYQDPAALDKVLSQYVKPGMKVLIVGCGNSAIGETLYDKGVLDITNIDFSEVVIEQMQAKCAEKDMMKWVAMDVREIDKEVCPDESFDVVFEKACLDSTMSGPGSARNVDRLLGAVSTALKPLGTFISISFSKPETRLPFLDNPGFKWDVDVDKKGMPKPMINPNDIADTRNVHFAYIMTKKF